MKNSPRGSSKNSKTKTKKRRKGVSNVCQRKHYDCTVENVHLSGLQFNRQVTFEKCKICFGESKRTRHLTNLCFPACVDQAASREPEVDNLGSSYLDTCSILSTSPFTPQYTGTRLHCNHCINDLPCVLQRRDYFDQFGPFSLCHVPLCVMLKPVDAESFCRRSIRKLQRLASLSC